MTSHLDITQPALPLALALPDSARALPQWITSPDEWGKRAPYLPNELGDWIWAPTELENAPFELIGEFEIPPTRGIVGAYATGAALDENSVVVAAINGVIGTAGGAIDTRGVQYRAFEGELSPWIQAGKNRIVIKVRPADEELSEDEKGCVFRLLVRYADGGEEVIVGDADWRARSWDGATAKSDRMISQSEGSLSEAMPVRVIATRDVPRAYVRPRLYSSAWAAPLLRREFTLPSSPRRAVLTICGLGYYEATLNGQRVGDHVLDPAQTTYEERAFYVRYDVTELLQTGDNALGIMLGHGWYGQNRAWMPHIEIYGKPAALAQLEIEDENGVSIVVSDENWRVAQGPVRSDNLYRGEIYDARRERVGWDVAGGGDGEDWRAVEIVPPLSPRLEEQTIPPIRRQQEIRPVSLTQPNHNCGSSTSAKISWAGPSCACRNRPERASSCVSPKRFIPMARSIFIRPAPSPRA